MEPGYLHLNWNHIPRMYFRKYFFRTLVIEKEDWAHLSEPTSLTQYWEPSQGPEDFHWTFALALCRTVFHDCEDASQRAEYMVSVAVVRKLARFAAILFASAFNKFRHDSDDSPTLILVQLHRHSKLFLDVYFDQYNQHFTVMHDSGKPFNVGHPQRFVGALLHNAYPDRDKPSPKAKLSPAFLDHPTKFPIDSCIRSYRDWTTGCDNRSNLDEHFVWLSNEFTPYMTDPGTPSVLPDFALGLPPIEDWPKQTGEVPWVLDPAEHPRLAVQSHRESTGPSSGDEKRWRRKKKKHQWPKNKNSK